MTAASYNRGSRVLARDIDAAMPAAILRAGREADELDVARLRVRVASLERELQRARRCIAAERAGREALRLRLSDSKREYAFAVGILCKLAFPNDRAKEVTR